MSNITPRTLACLSLKPLNHCAARRFRQQAGKARRSSRSSRSGEHPSGSGRWGVGLVWSRRGEIGMGVRDSDQAVDHLPGALPMLPIFRHDLPYLPVGPSLLIGWLVGFAFLTPATAQPATAQPAGIRQASHVEAFPSKPAIPDFVVTTTIASVSPSATLSRHHTVFRDGVAYDIPQLNRRFATILDLPSGRVVLLDRQNSVQCVLSTESLTKLAAAVEAEVRDPQQRERMGMNAKVVAADDGSWHVDYPGVSYRMAPADPDDQRLAIHYGQFVDWMCRLNLVRPGGVPPFGRMKANRVLTANHQIARSTRLELIDPDGPAKRFESETSWSTKVDARLSDQVAELAGMRVTFRQVPLEEFAH